MDLLLKDCYNIINFIKIYFYLEIYIFVFINYYIKLF